jgi:hypothetical protein
VTLWPRFVPPFFVPAKRNGACWPSRHQALFDLSTGVVTGLMVGPVIGYDAASRSRLKFGANETVLIRATTYRTTSALLGLCGPPHVVAEKRFFRHRGRRPARGRWGPPTTPRSSRMNELATKIISKGARRACADDRSEVWQTRKGSAGKFRFEQGTVLRNWDGAATACYDIMALSRDLPGQPAAL